MKRFCNTLPGLLLGIIVLTCVAATYKSLVVDSSNQCAQEVNFTGVAPKIAGAAIATQSYVSKANVGLSAVANALQLYKSGADLAGVAQGAVLYYSGTEWVYLAPGSSGQMLMSNGASANPSWGNSASAWSTVSASKYTATPAGTSTITMSDTSDMKVGLPLKYTYNSNTYYGLVTAVTTNTSITVSGAALNVGNDLTLLAVGTPERTLQVDYFVSGNWADATNATLLASDMNTYFSWGLQKAYLVSFAAVQKTAAATTQGKLNVRINGDDVSNADSGYGIQLSTAGTWVLNSAVSFYTDKYDINWGESVELNASGAATGTPSDLTVRLIFVLE